MPEYSRQVFLNVPFDARYKKLLRALVFAVHDCGFTARCAMEKDDSGEVRVEKIFQIISECRFGIHDLSRTTLDGQNKLPRFNMPLELGIFLGARRYGTGRNRQKACLVLDRDRYRYQIFCSDISGQDIKAHSNEVGKAVYAVRNWLQTHLTSAGLLGGAAIADRYIDFARQLPFMCKQNNLKPNELSFLDHRLLVQAWIETNPPE